MAQKPLAEGFLQALDEFAKRIECFASEFLEAVLHFLRDAATWLEHVVERIAQYLRKLFPLLGQVGIALIKLLLIYLPTSLCSGHRQHFHRFGRVGSRGAHLHRVHNAHRPQLPKSMTAWHRRRWELNLARPTAWAKAHQENGR